MKVSNNKDKTFNSEMTIISLKERIQRNKDYMYNMGKHLSYRKAMDFIHLDELAKKYDLDTEENQFYCYCLTFLNGLMNKIFMAVDSSINLFRHTLDQEIVDRLTVDYNNWCKKFEVIERDIDDFVKQLEEKHGKSMK